MDEKKETLIEQSDATLSDQSDVIITKAAHFPKRPKSHYENRHTLIEQINEKTMQEV